MSLSPNVPGARESYRYENQGSPRWIAILFGVLFVVVAAVALIDYTAQSRMERDVAKSQEQSKILTAQLEQANARLADIKGHVEVAEQKLGLPVAFPKESYPDIFPEIIAEAGLTQFRCAETEKYAHVTYFFNGGEEKPFSGEERILVPSSETVHFDTAPEMSAEKITDAVLANLDRYDFILVNFANADMVGHTGNFEATVKAIEALDFSLGKLAARILDRNGALIVTADHGNAEEKLYPSSGEKRTKHTGNPVPFFVIANEFKSEEPKTDAEVAARYTEVRGVLSDVAPTTLALMGIPKTGDMTGIDLLPKIK